MGVIVHGVDAPGVARAVVVGPTDAVHERIPQVHVASLHVDLGPQHLGAIRKLACLHALEQIEVLFGGSVPIGARLARHMEIAPVLADLGFGEVTDICLALLDQVLGVVVHELEVVRGVELSLPLEAQPLDVLADGVHILDVFLHGVRVVEAQVRGAAVGLRQPEVQADALGVADVQVAVGLRWEAREHPPPMLARGAVRLHDLLDEVEALGFGGGRVRRHGSFSIQKIRVPRHQSRRIRRAEVPMPSMRQSTGTRADPVHHGKGANNPVDEKTRLAP